MKVNQCEEKADMRENSTVNVPKRQEKKQEGKQAVLHAHSEKDQQQCLDCNNDKSGQKLEKSLRMNEVVMEGFRVWNEFYKCLEKNFTSITEMQLIMPWERKDALNDL